MKPLDFAAFDRKISLQEYWSAGFKGFKTLYMLAIVSFALFLVALMLFNTWFGNLSMFFFAASLYSSIFAWMQYRHADRSLRLRQFAERNSMSYTGRRFYDGRDGIIFGDGQDKMLVDTLISNSGDFEIGNYQFTTGDNKSKQVKSFGFIRLKLPRHLPNMVLDSKKNNSLGGRWSNLPKGLSSGQHLELEGDFNKYFTLYAPQQFERDALYVFTPDVMHALVESAHDYDCEVIDDNFYLYSQWHFLPNNQQQWLDAFRVIEHLRPELLQQTKNYRDERVGEQSKDIVSKSGQRLRTRWSIASIVTIVLLVAYFAVIVYPVLLAPLLR